MSSHYLSFRAEIREISQSFIFNFFFFFFLAIQFAMYLYRHVFVMTSMHASKKFIDNNDDNHLFQRMIYDRDARLIGSSITSV